MIFPVTITLLDPGFPEVLYIVNNYPVTKNKPIYHVRISKQMKGRAFTQQAHGVIMTSDRRRCDVMMSHRR